MRYGSIYMIRNKLNNKCYIGQTIKNPLVRAKKHFNKSGG